MNIGNITGIKSVITNRKTMFPFKKKKKNVSMLLTVKSLEIFPKHNRYGLYLELSLMLGIDINLWH